MCTFLYTVTSKNLLLKSLFFLFINTSSEADYYAVILAIGSEENSVAVYLKSETDSYYFSFAIWNSITKEYQNNYASAICQNVACYVYINGLNAPPDMKIHLSSIKPNIFKKCAEKCDRQKHSSH